MNIEAPPIEAVSDDKIELSEDLIKRLVKAFYQVDSTLDPKRKMFRRTLAELQSKAKKLTLIEYNWKNLSQLAYSEIKFAVKMGSDERKLNLPIKVQEWVFTKKNKARLIPSDPNSPVGITIKGDKEVDLINAPYATAYFNAFEIFNYAVNQLPETPDHLNLKDIPKLGA